MIFFVLLLFSYLLGSLNGAQLLRHILRGKFLQDITRIGTRNAGAQNVWMTLGKRAGTLVFAIDFLKGYLALKFGRMMGFDGALLILVGGAVIAGHNWPVFFRFRGGRGFASLIGIFFGFDATSAIIASFVSLPFGILRYAGITPFIFLIVGSFALYSRFGPSIILAYLFVAFVLFVRRVHAEWEALRAEKKKLGVLKNLLVYDRATNRPPSLRQLFR